MINDIFGYSVDAVNNGTDSLIDEINKLEAELAHYKQEAEKIPEICQYAPCEVGVCDITICPNWRGGGKEDARRI